MISLHVYNAEMLYALATANRDRDDGDLDYDVYAFELYLESAKIGHKDAERHVCQMLYGGIGCNKNPNNSFKWAKRLASKGDTWGQNVLAVHYINEEGTSYNPEEAIYWWKRAAFTGDGFAAFQWLNFTHQRIKRDLSSAEKWYRTAYERGNKSASVRLAELRKSCKEKRVEFLLCNSRHRGSLVNAALLICIQRHRQDIQHAGVPLVCILPPLELTRGISLISRFSILTNISRSSKKLNSVR